MVGADALVGLSVGGLVSGEMLCAMARDPIVFALANPNPEIGYQEATQARGDVIMATGRSDTPNQVNNVLGFPFIFRGALDVRATDINLEMKLAGGTGFWPTWRAKTCPTRCSRPTASSRSSSDPST